MSAEDDVAIRTRIRRALCEHLAAAVRMDDALLAAKLSEVIDVLDTPRVTNLR